MVQLKADTYSCIKGRGIQFQFQNGSIKSLHFLLNEIAKKLFQFQNGSIKRPLNALQSVPFTGFNSKMVQLKVC